jgi:hypothetical protein
MTGREGTIDLALAPARRAADFLALTKPRLVTLVLVTTLVGFVLGSSERLDGALLLVTLAGTALAGAGAMALNQYLERDVDAKMERTRTRPLPDGRLQPFDALAFVVAAASVGIVALTFPPDRSRGWRRRRPSRPTCSSTHRSSAGPRSRRSRAPSRGRCLRSRDGSPRAASSAPGPRRSSRSSSSGSFPTSSRLRGSTGMSTKGPPSRAILRER